MNRSIYKYNDVADRYAMKPIAVTYTKIVPQFMRTGVRNFFSNIDDLFVVINDVLQLKGTHAAQDSVRLVANTVFGGLGFVDVASMRGIPKRSEDFGQTLGYWGVPSGPYLVLPLLGPSSMRDGPARLVDAYYDPVWWIDNVRLRNSIVGVGLVNLRANLLPAEQLLDEASMDRYSFLRDAYLARRESLVYDGDPPRSKNDNLDDPGEGSADDPQ
ncbi:MAG: VacJ family lipoprotein [Burkholderiales bacterium]|nr:VacJ family lipoprotein [Burkholderiales bacterium]